MKTSRILCGLLLVLPMILRSASPDLLSIPLKDIEGKDTNLKALNAKAILVVNVASHCGNTPQYKGLQALYEAHKDKGLVVVGFPCNDFGAQEPGTNAEIKEFCSAKYKVTFPMMDKVHVKGDQQHPLYSALTGPGSTFPGNVKWNFGKFLISGKGEVLARFEPGLNPDAEELKKAIETALAP
jgi:glutathione peroxidase